MHSVWIVWKTLLILWASPYSLAGLAIGFVGIVTGGKGRYRNGAIEFYGGGTKWFVRRLPPGERTAGFTLGHTILGQNATDLDRVAAHERIHVRQFERWGFFMGPAYILASLWAWARGRDAYLDNTFEVEAYSKSP